MLIVNNPVVDGTVMAGPDMLGKVRAYDRLRRASKKIEADMKKLKAEIQEALPEGAVKVRHDGRTLVNLVSKTWTGVDGKALQAAEPEIYAEFLRSKDYTDVVVYH